MSEELSPDIGLEATTLEEIAFDGQPIAADCEARLWQEELYSAPISAAQRKGWKRAVRYSSGSRGEKIVRWGRPARPRIPRPPVDYRNPTQPGSIAAAKDPQELERYLMKARGKAARDIEALWRWFNTSNRELESMTPNYALLNGRSDVAWYLMEELLK